MNELQVIAGGDLAPELTVDEVKLQVEKIQGLMRGLMHNGEHYGIIPGTGKKPSLLKAGAEKLCFIFRLAPEFIVDRDDLPGGHREYRVTCRLRNMATGRLAGEGLGSCSTMEAKYRYRNSSDYEILDDPIPRDAREKKAEYRRQGMGMKQVDGLWCWVRYKSEGKVENPDIADVYNTVLKMAKKRAHVDATITTCAASDIFAQDIEDPEPEEPARHEDPEPEAAPIILGRNGKATSSEALRRHLEELKADPCLVKAGREQIESELAREDASAEELAALVEKAEKNIATVKAKREGKA